MRRVALIYNPASGQRPERRAAAIAEVAAVLRGAGVEVKAIATESPESAGTQAHAAMEEGYDTIMASAGMAPCMKRCSGWWAERRRWAWFRWERRTRWLRTWGCRPRR